MGDFYFQPIEFINNLKYMGIGMLGVLMIVAIIMGATYLVSYLTNAVSARKEAEESGGNSEDNG